MTEQEYTERNELISDFLGLRYRHGYHTNPIVGAGSTKILEYHHNWNWLMIAWFKFRDMRFDKVIDQFQHSNLKGVIANRICYENIDKAFNELTKAIQWYNAINKNNHEVV